MKTSRDRYELFPGINLLVDEEKCRNIGIIIGKYKNFLSLISSSHVFAIVIFRMQPSDEVSNRSEALHNNGVWNNLIPRPYPSKNHQPKATKYRAWITFRTCFHVFLMHGYTIANLERKNNLFTLLCQYLYHGE